MSIIMHYVDRLHEIMDKHADPRTSHWFLISSPFPTLFICLAYVYVVKVLGPKLMENRKPFQLREVLIAYNLFQVMFSAWIFWELAMSGWITGDYSLKCQPIDKSNGRQAMRMAHACWWYYFSKFTEFFDTIFFVLRKKNNHVSALHVIHHGCMPMSVWFGVKFTPGGHSSFFGLLNTFVHIIMYSYYLLAAMGPSIQPYLWWKKYLTALQMVQFVLVMAHAFQLLFIECNYPKAFVWWIGLHAIMFFTLFNEFYKQSYAKEEKSKRNKIETRVEAGAKASNGSVVNGKSAGITNGDGVNSRRRDAADYYVKGESLAASEMHLRKSYTATE
ncbi:elongation of very long chain fatty acids protein AAEL008004-like isoform X1 [Venturia canescens]|uniref:elongation of very long chain fatty acids protein AAEL008004-like isoform X1 n=1 Tax=Venturia canescens TaxID=32260 RepID=UPI001C9D5A9A|nr:elongation of very long chain fatty acids protein AAEL008004-like isoform X1 [Venturia canescens]XP_043282345.1 elongation of very long chain fatty acids protein AAEL008004-like isoform X1 [Venturia canescens]XP_043282349.1 elongation of very long chain fatty acids protein AAEL008004-like isoform X1 [Venturia canescens]